MELTKSDIQLLFDCGCDESDIPQIKEAYKKSRTKYSLDGKRITREEAIDRLGWNVYLTGIARSAFHYTAARETDDGKVVLFDSHNLFE